MASATTREWVHRAWKNGLAVPAFNIPYLPMMEPVVRALADTRTAGLIMVARLEWIKFAAGSIEAVRDEYARVGDRRVTRLHLDHVPVIDEDNLRVDYAADIGRAIRAGYESVMVDGSRLSLEENIACTRRVSEMARAAGIPVEAELGAVMGHEAGPLPPYEELFRSRRGFTDPDEAERFVRESGADWLSIAVGSIHGAISDSARARKKIEARLDIGHLDNINRRCGVPLVLHGGTGIARECIRDAVRHGIAKINVATAIRQPYERHAPESPARARDAVYAETVRIVREELAIEGSAEQINNGGNRP
ncbi:MAG: class II fructose-bisphosphate aldolase [Lentisphaerae bacterium]|nr:class II fructose-bisphosphate aldolase [Lentisphaerota bacterium]